MMTFTTTIYQQRKSYDCLLVMMLCPLYSLIPHAGSLPLTYKINNLACRSENQTGFETIVALCLPEVTNVEIDMEGQKVLVTSTLSGDELLAKLKKTGRECSYVGVKE